jgi:hypothetical protein
MVRPTQSNEGGGKPMKKMSIRKAGTIRLTNAVLYCCASA